MNKTVAKVDRHSAIQNPVIALILIEYDGNDATPRQLEFAFGAELFRKPKPF